MRVDTRKLCVLAMMCAMAFLLAAFVRIPIVPAVSFLRYDPKDIVIAIAGFIYGPLAALIVAVVVSFMQMVTGVSATGQIGLVMNIAASAALCCTAAIIYKKNRTLKGALLGLIVGGIFATVVMMMLNYTIAPHFFGWPRERIVPLMLPGFLPFNLISNGVNIILTLLLYKRVKGMLQAARMMPHAEETEATSMSRVGVTLTVILVVLACVLGVLIRFEVL